MHGGVSLANGAQIHSGAHLKGATLPPGRTTPRVLTGTVPAVAKSPLGPRKPTPAAFRPTKETLPDLSAFSPRERILAAALKLFVEQGYFNTNIPDLSRESRCSVGSIYHTFRNKEEVASALYQEGINAFRTALLSSLRGKEDIADVVRSVVRSFLQFSQLNQQLSRYIWLCRHNEFMSGIIKHPTTVGFDDLGRLLARSIKRGIREKKIRALDAHTIWTLLFGLPLSYTRDWLDGYNPLPPSDMADTLADACWRALKAD
jgi:TetR/AcrR family transcriptional regulator, repressor of fatR-cypB operon